MNLKNKKHLIFLLLLGINSVGVLYAQNIETLKAGVVRITAVKMEFDPVTNTEKPGPQRTGTGFIAELTWNKAYIVTSSHVVAGVEHPKVEFYTRRDELVEAEVVESEPQNPDGFALLRVKGEANLPLGLSRLSLGASTPPKATEAVFAIGNPIVGVPWSVIPGQITGRKGRFLATNVAIEQGNSGGPLIKENQVVGMMTKKRGAFGYAVLVASIQIFLDGCHFSIAPVRLSSKPDNDLSNHEIVEMIKRYRFNHPGDLSRDGLSGPVKGYFWHSYALSDQNGEKVIIDGATGLMWQQFSSEIENRGAARVQIEEYIARLNNIAYAGFSDWRLPTIEELASLLAPERNEAGFYIDPMFKTERDSPFDPVREVCWSADQKDSYTNWVANFKDGTVEESTLFVYVRAVRSME